MNLLKMNLDCETLNKALEGGVALLQKTQDDALLDADAKSRWKFELEKSNERIREMQNRENFVTTMKDRTVFMMHMSLIQEYIQIVESRKVNQ